MRRRLLVVLTVCLGLGLVALGVLVGVVSPPTASEDVPGWLGAVVVLLVLVLTAWKLFRSPQDADTAPAPWTDDGALAETPPEATPDTDRISGTAFTDHMETAAREARREATVDAGLSAVREPLRETLVAALRQGGLDEDRIDDVLASGSWTDDRVAAAVVDERVSPPRRSLRRRVWAWLFPHKAVRHRAARSVGAVSRAADQVLPPVVGQRAPRPVPVVEPTVEDLQRAADGSLRRAVEGRAAVRPPETDGDDADGGAPESDATAPDTGETADDVDEDSPRDDTNDELTTDDEPIPDDTNDEPPTADTVDGEWPTGGGD